MNLLNRREAIKFITSSAAALTAAPSRVQAQPESPATLAINPARRFELSPSLYMQFMEPLGATDGSVEAAWDHQRDRWREDVVAVTRELAPPMLRWGGIFTDYYRWREGVGPRDQRVPMLNLLWGGVESNQIGTVELMVFCEQVGATPLICVNFESDGRDQFREVKGKVRCADAREAADWVAYCNAPDNAERRSHGHPAPFGIRHWQIGNETAYDQGGFNLETAVTKTVEFAQAMRRADPSIQLI